MQRRFLVNAILAAALAGRTAFGQAQAAKAAKAPATAAGLPSIAVLDFELVDDHPNPATAEATAARLVKATAQLQDELRERGLYRVVDPAPSKELQAKLRNQQAFLYRCDDCAWQVGALLGTDLVMTTWVQKVSELILNMNVEIHDVKAKKVVLSKSIDMRSNDDVSWTRGVSYLVRSMAEKRANNPHYGM